MICPKCGCEIDEMADCCPGCLAPVDKRKASTMALLGLRYEPEPKATPPDAEPKINPEWVKSLQAERDALRVEYEIRRDWIANLCSIIGYDNYDGKHGRPDPFEIVRELQRLAVFGAQWETDSSLEKWFPFSAKELEELRLKTIQPDEFGCHKHVAQWLAAGTYRTLCHRHDGTFVAGDESERLMMRADTIPLLSDSLLNWPNGAEALPPAHFIKVTSPPH